MLPLVSATDAVLSSVRLAVGVVATGVETVSVAGVTSIVPTLSASAEAVLTSGFGSVDAITWVLPVAVQTAVAPAARLAIVHDRPGSSGSLTTTLVSASVPVLVTLKL